MKKLSILAAALALPASVAFAQTPTPPRTTGGQANYIPLFGSGGTGGGAAGSSAWFIDTTRNQVVLCTQSGTGDGGGGAGAQSFTCTSQPIPNTGGTPTTPPTGGGTPPTGGGTPPTGGGTPPAGGVGANPMGG